MTDTGFILVVDDDDDIRQSLCDLLEDEGHATIGVSDGQQALDTLNSRGLPCMILLDLMMPVMDGAEFRQRQLANPHLAHIPVVLITAAGKAATTAMSADRVLPKPIKVELLFEAVATFCGHGG